MSGRKQIQIYARRDGTLGWRLLGANNHEIGRGSRAHLTEDLCRQEIAALQRSGILEGRIRPSGGNRWLWEILHAGLPVAVAAHTFDRPIRCQQSINLFLAELPDAAVGATVPAWAVPGHRLPALRAVPRVLGMPVVPARP